jgi:hypothetical protein
VGCPPLIGSLPIMAPPTPVLTYPANGNAYPGTSAAQPGVVRTVQGQTPPAFGQRSQPAAQPRPIIRAQSAEEPATKPRPPSANRAPAPFTIPTPEELGVSATTRADHAPADWSALHQRLSQLGATCFQMQKFPEGGCRMTCLLPASQSGRSHCIETQATNDVEAIRLTLAKADAWLAGR